MVHIFDHRPDDFGRPSFNICLLPVSASVPALATDKLINKRLMQLGDVNDVALPQPGLCAPSREKSLLKIDIAVWLRQLCIPLLASNICR